MQNRPDHGMLTSKPKFLHFLIFSISSRKWLTNYFVSSEFFWCRNWNIMDWIYLRTKFGSAQFQYLQAIISQLALSITMLGTWSRNMSFLWRESLFNKTIEHKICSSCGHVHKMAGKAIEHNNFFHLKKLHWPFRGKNMHCCWLGRKLMLIFCHAADFSCRQFSLRERISKSACLQHTTMMLE